MSDYTIYALKAGDEDMPASILFDDLKLGEGRFGWSYVETGDLNALKGRIENNGWDSLTEQEQDCFSGRFLLDIKAGDWLVYINMPEWGMCAAARVIGPYQWKWGGASSDFNHRIPVDPESVFIFDRNDAIVHPTLRARLKLQGRYWKIYARSEFESLVKDHKAGLSGFVATQKSDLKQLSRELRPHLETITHAIHRTHPNTSLEGLLAETFKKVPGVKEVRWQGGAGDGGADIVVVFETGLPISGLTEQRICLVQVKSFVGEHGDTKAIDDIRRAFGRFPEAESGLIVSTASTSSPWFDQQLEQMRLETKKPVALMIGADVAAFFLRYGAQLLD